MGKCRNMGAGLAGSTSRSFNVNVNQVQFGNKLQGLPPMLGIRRPSEIYRSRAGGNAPDRFKLFCINQLGNVGFANKGSQFASNADGVRPCPSSGTQAGSTSLTTLASLLDMPVPSGIENNTCLTNSEKTEAELIIQNLKEEVKKCSYLTGYDLVFMGNMETVMSDIAAGENCSVCTGGETDPIYKSSDFKLTDQKHYTYPAESATQMISRLNELIGKSSCFLNSSVNGGCAGNLGAHEVAFMTEKTQQILQECGFGVPLLGTMAYANKNQVTTNALKRIISLRIIKSQMDLLKEVIPKLEEIRDLLTLVSQPLSAQVGTLVSGAKSLESKGDELMAFARYYSDEYITRLRPSTEEAKEIRMRFNEMIMKFEIDFTKFKIDLGNFRQELVSEHPELHGVINKVDSLGIDMDGASQLPVDEDDTGDEVEKVEEEREDAGDEVEKLEGVLLGMEATGEEDPENDEEERYKIEEEDKIEEEANDNIQNDDYPSGN